MYITFKYNEKGNFSISQKVIGKLVAETITSETNNITVKNVEIEILKGLQIYIKPLISVPSDKTKSNLDISKLILKINDVINDLLSISPYNISFSIEKK